MVGHFRNRAHGILVACKAYKEGAEIGSMVQEGAQDVNGHEMSSSSEFKEAIDKMMKTLVTNFMKIGCKDCEQFQVSATVTP